jgi:hypothetical protein
MGQQPNAARIAAGADFMDARRRRQIDNQIKSINRLMQGPRTYDDEMRTLHEELAKRDALLDELYDELRGLGDSLDDSVISIESERLQIHGKFIELMTTIQEARSGS